MHAVSLTLYETDRGFSLLIPAMDSLRKIWETEVRTDSRRSFPYWAKLWPSAKAMSLFLDTSPGLITGKTVLEIGAGIGLPAFIAAKTARDVLITDYDPDAVALIRKNISRLQLHNTRAAQLDWNRWPENSTADVIILSDVNYAPGQFVPLLKLIRQFLDAGITLLLATPQRLTSTVFIDELASYIQERQLFRIQEESQQTAVAVLVLRKAD